jgi:hypothetical protein
VHKNGITKNDNQCKCGGAICHKEVGLYCHISGHCSDEPFVALSGCQNTTINKNECKAFANDLGYKYYEINIRLDGIPYMKYLRPAYIELSMLYPSERQLMSYSVTRNVRNIGEDELQQISGDVWPIHRESYDCDDYDCTSIHGRYSSITKVGFDAFGFTTIAKKWY